MRSWKSVLFPDISCRFSKAGIEDNAELAELWTADTNKLLCIMGTHGMELDPSAVGGAGILSVVQARMKKDENRFNA